jgi:hypothetical protein
MRSVVKLVAAVAMSTSLIASSGAAAAGAPGPQVQQAQTPNAWMMLSVLSPTRAVALGGAAAAAQPADVPPPPPPVAVAGGPVITGEVIPFVLWFALIAIALTISGESGRPNSPA